MLRITITKIKKAWSLALAARGRGVTKTIPGKFHRLLVVNSAQKSTTSGKDADPRCKKCEQIIKYIFDSNCSVNDYKKIQEIIRNSKKSKGSRIVSIQKKRSAIINRESKIVDNLKRQSTTVLNVQKSQGTAIDSQKSLGPVVDTQKLGKLIGKIYGKKDVSRSEAVTSPISSINNATILKATTAKQTEEQLAQKIEIIEEVPLVEAEKQKIEGFNTTPKILGQSNAEKIFNNDSHRLSNSKIDREAMIKENVKNKIENLLRKIESGLLTENIAYRKNGLVNFATNDSGQQGKSGGTSDVDKEGSEKNQDTGYPNHHIDERFIKGMKQLGVPGSGGGSTIDVHTDTSKKSRTPMGETDVEARKFDNEKNRDAVGTEHLTFPPLSNNSYLSETDSTVKDESTRYSNADHTQAKENEEINKGEYVVSEQKSDSEQIPDNQQQIYNEQQNIYYKQQQQMYNQQFVDNGEQPGENKGEDTSGIVRYSDQTTLNKEGDEANKEERAGTEQKSEEQQEIYNQQHMYNEQSGENREPDTSGIVRYADQTTLNKEGDEANKDERADTEQKSDEQQQIYNQQQMFNEQSGENRDQDTSGIVRYADQMTLNKEGDEANKDERADTEQKSDEQQQIYNQQHMYNEQSGENREQDTSGIVRYADQTTINKEGDEANKAERADSEQKSNGQQQIYNQQQMFNEQSGENREQDTSGIVRYADQTTLNKEGEEANKDENVNAEQKVDSEQKIDEQQQIYNQQQIFNQRFADNREQRADILRYSDQNAMVKEDEEANKAQNIHAEQKPEAQINEEQVLVPDRGIIRYSDSNNLTKEDQDVTDASKLEPEQLTNVKTVNEQPLDSKEQKNKNPETPPAIPNIQGQYPKLTPYGMFYPNFQYPNANFYNGQGFAYPRHFWFNEHPYASPDPQISKIEQKAKQENEKSESAEQETQQESGEQTSPEDSSNILEHPAPSLTVDQKTPLLAIQLKPTLGEYSPNNLTSKPEELVFKPKTKMTELIAVKPAFDEKKSSEPSSRLTKTLKENDLSDQVVAPDSVTYEYPVQAKEPPFSLYGNYTEKTNAFPSQNNAENQPQVEKSKQYYHMQKTQSKLEEKGKGPHNPLEDKTVLNVDPMTTSTADELKPLMHSTLKLELNMASLQKSALNKKLKSSEMEAKSPELLKEEDPRSETQTPAKSPEIIPESETVMTVSAPVKDTEPCVQLPNVPASEPIMQLQAVENPSHEVTEKLQNEAPVSAPSPQKIGLKHEKLKEEAKLTASGPLKEEINHTKTQSVPFIPLLKKTNLKREEIKQESSSVTSDIASKDDNMTQQIASTASVPLPKETTLTDDKIKPQIVTAATMPLPKERGQNDEETKLETTSRVIPALEEITPKDEQTQQSESMTSVPQPKEINTESDHIKEKPASTAPSPEEKLPEEEKIPLSEMLRRVRMRSCKELLKALEKKLEPIEGKCGTPKEPCPPPTPKCPCAPPPPPPPCPPPPPRCPRPCKSSPCPPPCSPTKEPKKPCCKMVAVTDTLKSIFAQLWDLGSTRFPYQTPLANTYQIHSKDSFTKAVLTEEVTLQLQDWGCRMLTTYQGLGQCYWRMETIALARSFEPWVPIPSWPIPKKKEKKKLVCPKDGCKQRPPPRYGDPCEEPCYPDVTPRREKKSRAPPEAAVKDPYDKIAERCTKIPANQIDEQLLAEMEKLGVLKTTACPLRGDKHKYRHAKPRKGNRNAQITILKQLERLHSSANKKYRATKEPRIMKYIPNSRVKIYKHKLKQLYGIKPKSATNLDEAKPVELFEESRVDSEKKRPIFDDKMPLIDPYDKKSLKHFSDEDFTEITTRSDSNFIFDHYNYAHVASKLCINAAKEEKAINETIYSAMRQFQKLYLSKQSSIKHNPKCQKPRLDYPRKHKIKVANALKTTQSFKFNETVKKPVINYSLAEKIPTAKELRDIKQPLVIQSSILPSFQDIEDNDSLQNRNPKLDKTTTSQNVQPLESFEPENLVQLIQPHKVNITYPIPRPSKQTEENKALKPRQDEINDQNPQERILETFSLSSKRNKKHIITILPSNIHEKFLQKQFQFSTKFGDEKTHRLLAQAAIFSSEPPKSPSKAVINKKITPSFSNRKRQASMEKITFDRGLIEQHKAPDLTEYKGKAAQSSQVPTSWNPEKYNWNYRQLDAEAKARLAQELVNALKVRFTLVVKPQNTKRNLNLLKIKSQRANYERCLKAKPSTRVSVANSSQPLESLKLVADYNRQLDDLKLKSNMTSQKLQSEAVLETKSNTAFIVPLAVQAKNKTKVAKLVSPNDQNRLKKNRHPDTEQAENKTTEVEPDSSTVSNASEIQNKDIRPGLLYQMNNVSNWKEKINQEFKIRETKDNTLKKNTENRDLVKPLPVKENDATSNPVLSAETTKPDISDETNVQIDTSKLPTVQNSPVLETKTFTTTKKIRKKSMKSTVAVKQHKKIINQGQSTETQNRSLLAQKCKTSTILEKPLQDTQSNLSSELQTTENLKKNELNLKTQPMEAQSSNVPKQNTEQKQSELYDKDTADHIKESMADEYALERARNLAESTKFFGEALKKASIKPPATDLSLEKQPKEKLSPSSDDQMKQEIINPITEQDMTDYKKDIEKEVAEKNLTQNQTEAQGFIKQIQNALYSFTGSKTATKEDTATEETKKAIAEKNEESLPNNSKTTQNDFKETENISQKPNQDIKSILVILPKLKPEEQREKPLSEVLKKVRDSNSRELSEELKEDCQTKASDDKIIPKCPKGPCGPKPPPPCPCGPTKPECPIVCPRPVPPCPLPRCPHKPIPRPLKKMPKCPPESPTTPRPTGPCTPCPCSPSKPLIKGPPCPCPPIKPPCKPCPPPCPPPVCPPPCPKPCTPKPPCPPLKCPCDPPPCPPCKCPPPCPDSPCPPPSPHPTCPPPAPPPCPPKPPCCPPKCPPPCPRPCPDPPPCPLPKCPSQKSPPPCPPPKPPPCPKLDTTPCKPLKWPCKPPKKPCS